MARARRALVVCEEVTIILPSGNWVAECEIRYNGEEKIVMRLIEVLVTFGLT